MTALIDWYTESCANGALEQIRVGCLNLTPSVSSVEGVLCRILASHLAEELLQLAAFFLGLFMKLKDLFFLFWTACKCYAVLLSIEIRLRRFRNWKSGSLSIELLVNVRSWQMFIDTVGISPVASRARSIRS